MWPTVRFSRSGEERHRRGLRRVVSQNSTACVLPAGEPAKRLLERAAFRPSSVDMLGGPESAPRRSATLCIRAPKKGGDPAAPSGTATLLRLHPNHEPHLRRLPPVRVGSPASGVAHFRGVTGGVYKARERIHPDVADSGLLATPPSWRRVSASNPNRDRLFGIRSTSRYRSPLYRPM